MDDVINLETLRAEVDRKGCLLSETWTDLYSLLTKYQAQLHVKYDGIREHVIKSEPDDQNGESQELHEAKQEIHRKETLLSKYQIDLIKTTDTLERVKHELRLCQAKLEQVTDSKHRQDEELQRLKSNAEKREETICQLRGVVYAKETELVHKSRLLANTAGMYDGAVAKSLQLSSENNLLRDELDRQRQMHEDFLKHCTCNPSKRRRKLTSPSPMSAPVSNCTSPVNDKPSPPTPSPLTPLTPSPTTPSQPRELNRSHSLESRGDSRELAEECRDHSDSRSSNPSPITTITALSRQGSTKHRRPASTTEYRVDYRPPYSQDYQKSQPTTPTYSRSSLPSPTSSQHVVNPAITPVHINRPTLSHLPLRSNTPTSEPGPVHTPSILTSSLTMGGTLGKARKAMAALAKSESREEKEEEKSPPVEASSPVDVIPTAPMVMVYDHFRPGTQISAIPIPHKPASMFGILPAGTTLTPVTGLASGPVLSVASSAPHQNSLNNSSVGLLSGGSVVGNAVATNSLCSNSSNSSNSSLEAEEAREESDSRRRRSLPRLSTLNMNEMTLGQSLFDRDAFFLKMKLKTFDRYSGLQSNTMITYGEQKIMMHNGSHVLARLPQTGKTERPRKRCRVCYRSGRRKETPYHCAQCPGKPGLCASPCFQDYHGKIASGEWKDMVETNKELSSPIASPNDIDDERSQPIFPKVEEEKPRKTDIVPSWLRASNSNSASKEPCDMSLSKKD